MTFSLTPGKLGFKLGDVAVGLQAGTTDTPETFALTQNNLHTLLRTWNPDTLAYESLVSHGEGGGLEVVATNGALGDYDTMLDDTTTANMTYVGYAVPGSSTASAVWRIKRIDATTGLAIRFADGNANFDNVWNNRASLSY